MAIYLVRHAIARGRANWDDDDDLRPLTGRGRRQASGLINLLPAGTMTALYSSPALRCMDTLLPMAEHLDQSVKPHQALAEGDGAAAAVDLLRSLSAAGDPVAVCSHGDVIPDVLRVLQRDGLTIDGELSCAKGSTWELQVDGAGRFTTGTYLPPTE